MRIQGLRRQPQTCAQCKANARGPSVADAHLCGVARVANSLPCHLVRGWRSASTPSIVLPHACRVSAGSLKRVMTNHHALTTVPASGIAARA